MEQDKIPRKTLQHYLEQTEQSQTITEANLHRAAELIQSFKKVAVDQSEDNCSRILLHDYLHDYLHDIIGSIEPTIKHKGHIGLGMHVVYNLVVQKLGGNIQITSAPHQGFALTITTLYLTS